LKQEEKRPLRIIASIQTWWHTRIIPALRRLRQEDHEFETSLVYIVRPLSASKLKKKKKGQIV
jgi:hypothetical protein